MSFLTLEEFLFENSKPITQKELNEFEKFVDKLFSAINIDVEFTRHFLDRLNDERNKKQITIEELTQLFNKHFKENKEIIKMFPEDFEAVLVDLQSNINIPVVMNFDRKSDTMEMVTKTIMRKKNFLSYPPKYEV